MIGITHTPSKVAKLESMGIEPLIADLRDSSTLEKKLKGVDGFYIVTDPFSASTDKEEWDSPSWAKDEIQQGESALRAAHAAGVPHVVLASVSILGLEKGFGIHKSKLSIENEAKRLGINFTSLRPPFFMEGWIWGARYKAPFEYMKTGRIDSWPIKADTLIPNIATDDIGKIVAWSFANPDKSIGQTWEIVGQMLTLPEIAQAFSKRSGRSFVFIEPQEESEIPFFVAVNHQEYDFDPIFWTEKFGFEMTTFEGFLASADLVL